MKTRLILETVIPADHKLQIEIPSDVPSGPAVIAVEIASAERPEIQKPYLTAEELLNSPILGMWADRADIHDSAEFVRELRAKEERYRGLRD